MIDLWWKIMLQFTNKNQIVREKSDRPYDCKLMVLSLEVVWGDL